jgi:hypothetical protein
VTQLKPRNVQNALTRKGFRQSEGDHARFIFYPGDRKTKIRTMLSHNSRDLGNELIHRMAVELRLTKADFLNLVSCTLSGEQYILKLRENGINLDPVA